MRSFILFILTLVIGSFSQAVAKEEASLCSKEWPGLYITPEQAQGHLSHGVELIKKSGEHPRDEDLEEIVRSLSLAAESGNIQAQLKLGWYVVGYWMTDELFWPKRPIVAIKALAMLRNAAIQLNDKGPQNDPFLKALALTPPRFEEEAYKLPSEWMEAALRHHARWSDCLLQLNPKPQTP